MAGDIVERCARIGTSTWSDALDDLGIDGVVRGLQQRSGQGRFAAFAVTARGATGPLGTYRLEEFAVGQMLGAVKDGEVLVVDMGGAEVSTFWGHGGSCSHVAQVCCSRHRWRVPGHR